MRRTAIATVLAVTGSIAHADVFTFSDADGFEKCMRLDSLVETVHTKDGDKTRVVEADEIQARCVDAGAGLIASNRKPALGIELVRRARRLGPALRALPLADATTALALPPCNDLDVYTTLMAPLSLDNGDAWIAKARGPIKRCLADHEFRTDFIDEQHSDDANRAANACRILLDEKVVKACKGAH